MNGGKTILGGLVILVVFLLKLVFWHGLWHLSVLLVGGLPLVLIALGAVGVWIGVTDLKAQRAEAKTGDSAPAA